MSDIFYQIGEFSKISNISTSTLRYYDEIGLLKPSYTNPYSNYRLYSEENLNDVRIIKALKDLDFSLEEIMNFLGNITDEPIKNKIDTLEKRKEILEEQIEYLKYIHEILKETPIQAKEAILQLIKSAND